MAILAVLLFPRVRPCHLDHAITCRLIKFNHAYILLFPLTVIGEDPHIKTFNGTWFDYMGQCDLVYLRDSKFEENKSLDIHVRTTVRYDYSYIESAAVRIGDDILEVTSFGEYVLNGVSEVDLNGDAANVAGFPIYHTQPTEKSHIFDIVIGVRENITLSTFKDLVTVKITEAHKSHFGRSEGLIGTFSGATVGRDGNVMSVEGDGANAFGEEWQVREDEPMLFRSVRAPQYPAKCVLPTPAQKESRKLRRAEGISRAAAEKACAHLGDDRKEACISDVIAVGDIEIAQGGMY